MMMKSVFWWRKPEHPEETTDLRQVTDETCSHIRPCPVRGLNLGRSGVKQSELRRNESGALAVRTMGRVVYNGLRNKDQTDLNFNINQLRSPGPGFFVWFSEQL